MRSKKKEKKMSNEMQQEKEKFVATIERLKKAFADECVNRVGPTIEEKQREFSNLMNEALRKKNEYLRLCEKIADLQERIGQLDNLRRDNKVGFEEQFERILKLPGVKKVEVVSSQINIHTNLIICKYKGERYIFGYFLIEVKPFSGSSAIKITNLTHSVSWGSRRIDHPHVAEHCCFGNVEITISQLLADHKYWLLVSMLLKFLRSYSGYGNTEVTGSRYQAYAPIYLWPKWGKSKEHKEWLKNNTQGSSNLAAHYPSSRGSPPGNNPNYPSGSQSEGGRSTRGFPPFFC